MLLASLTLTANTAAKNSYGALAKPLPFVFPLQEIKVLVVRETFKYCGFCNRVSLHTSPGYIAASVIGNLAVTVF